MQTSLRVNDCYFPHLDNLTETQIYYGGSSSGKSVFLAQRAVLDVITNKRNYLIVRAVAKTIKRSVFAEIRKAIKEAGAQGHFRINETDMTVTCIASGNQILFAGLDDVEKLKSITPTEGVITDVWIEEATEAQETDLKQLEKRLRGGDENTPKRITLSFNPIYQTHWIFEKYFKTIGWADDQTEYRSANVFILKTTYRDNLYLTTQDRERLESEKDAYFYSVYTLGNWGVLGDVIFTNWSIVDLSEMAAQMTNRRHGLDFGFADDPAAMPCTHYDTARKTIYIYDELYEYGLTNDLLAVEIKKLVGSDYVTADSAEPKSIKELQNHGVHVGAAKKGKDSVNHGIQWLQQQRIVVDTKCVNMQNELRIYQWKKNKDGKSIRQPSERDNHLIDGLRYAYEGSMAAGWLVHMPEE